MEKFKFNETGVLLATSNSVRGLDFSGLTHVYTLYLPIDIREYLHLAGRVGRIGQYGCSSGKGGKVTSIISEEDANQFEILSNKLSFNYVDVQYTDENLTDTDLSSQNIENVRKYLEDSYLLLDTDEAEDV